MKHFFLLFFTILTLHLLPSGLYAQEEEESPKDVSGLNLEEKDKEGTMNALMKVMEYSKNRNYTKFADMMVYSGRDPNRQFKAMINFDDPHERIEVENSVNKINFLMRKSETYNATNFRKMEGMGFQLYLSDLEFTNLKGKVKTYKVSFVKRNGAFYFCSLK